MRIAETAQGDVVVLRPSGAVRSSADALVLDGRLQGLLDGGTRGLVIDCAEVGALGSGAVRALFRVARKLARDGRRLALVHAGDHLRRALEVSGFDKDFFLAKDLGEALAAASGGPPPPETGERALAAAILRALGAPPLPAQPEACEPRTETARALVRVLTLHS